MIFRTLFALFLAAFSFEVSAQSLLYEYQGDGAYTLSSPNGTRDAGKEQIKPGARALVFGLEGWDVTTGTWNGKSFLALVTNANEGSETYGAYVSVDDFADFVPVNPELPDGVVSVLDEHVLYSKRATIGFECSYGRGPLGLKRGNRPTGYVVILRPEEDTTTMIDDYFGDEVFPFVAEVHYVGETDYAALQRIDTDKLFGNSSTLAIRSFVNAQRDGDNVYFSSAATGVIFAYSMFSADTKLPNLELGWTNEIVGHAGRGSKISTFFYDDNPFSSGADCGFWKRQPPRLGSVTNLKIDSDPSSEFARLVCVETARSANRDRYLVVFDQLDNSQVFARQLYPYSSEFREGIMDAGTSVPFRMRAYEFQSKVPEDSALFSQLLNTLHD